MKSFLGGLALATGMALLNGTVTPPPSVCFVFPKFESHGRRSCDTRHLQGSVRDPSCELAEAASGLNQLAATIA